LEFPLWIGKTRQVNFFKSFYESIAGGLKRIQITWQTRCKSLLFWKLISKNQADFMNNSFAQD
jgi:hypothetical protein